MNNVITKSWKIVKKCMRMLITNFLHLLDKELNEDKWLVFLQFIKFGIIGVSNTVVSYLINVACLYLFDILGVFVHKNYIIANFIAFMLSVLWSFYWNDKLVFNLESHDWKSLIQALLKMYLSYAFTGIFMNTILLVLWVDLLNISKYVAPLINSAIGVPINFILNKFWAFKNSKD